MLFRSIIARPSNDPENPGIWIDLHRPGADRSLQLALVEYSTDEGDLLKDEGHIITRIWGDGHQQEYTERVLHDGIEDCFHTEKADAEKGYIVLCSPTQALGMIVDLGSGPMTENGDRSSQYFTIAKGRRHIDKTVTVALIENIHGLSEGTGYYTLHLIDDVNGKPCQLYHTDDLSEDSLVNLLKEILDSLE